MPPAAAPIGASEAKRRLEDVGQAHVLAFYDELGPDEAAALLRQIDALPLASIPGWVERYVEGGGGGGGGGADASHAEPPDYFPADPERGGRAWDPGAAREVGAALLGAGKVAAFTVAGGQGTRLGFDGPKGAFPATPILRKPLFRVFAEQLSAAQARFGAPIPWYIMTSPMNHGPTVSLFNGSAFFGLDPDDVMFFEQGVLPSFDRASGRMLLASKHQIATNPDGHGGSLRALHASGALRDMRRRGVEHISYTHVDNPLAKLIDPVFLGLHASGEGSSGQMSSKMVAKAAPEERVGVFGAIDGAMRVIEYSNLPAALAEAREPDGRLRFNAGNIGVHVMAVDFVASLNEGGEGGGFRLPLHRAEKRVPHVDPATGRAVEPEAPNAVKLESFVFDALPMCDGPLVYEVERVEEFAPIKNAEGTDSPATSAALQTARAARWLERAGASPPRREDGAPDCVIELSPLAALEPGDLEGRDLPVIEPGAEVVIE